MEWLWTSNILDAECLKLETQSVFLSEMDSEDISKRLCQKVTDRILLSEEELMEFIILPLTYKGKDEKNKSTGQSADMANRIEDEEQRGFSLSGIAVFADKVIEEENINIIMEGFLCRYEFCLLRMMSISAIQ